MSDITENPEAYENALITKLNKLRKQELQDLSKNFEIPITINMTCQQLKKRIQKFCLNNPLKMQEVFDKLGGLDNFNKEVCLICWDVMGRQMNDIGCESGKHWAHWRCLAKTGKEICPYCKEPIKIPSSQFCTLESAKVLNDIGNYLNSIGMNTD